MLARSANGNMGQHSRPFVPDLFLLCKGVTRAMHVGCGHARHKGLPPLGRAVMTWRAGLGGMNMRAGLSIVVLALLAGCATTTLPPQADVLLRGGTIYDGSGGAPYVGDVAVSGDRIACVGQCRGGGAAGDRRPRPRGRAGLHQHAELGEREPDRRRPRAERHPPGRDAGGDGRGRVDGPARTTR